MGYSFMLKARTPLDKKRWFSGERDEWAIRRKESKSRAIGAAPTQPRFSIVSAVYNVEKYLSDFFFSILLQPEFLGQIQLIVVNDGSTDKSLEMLESWQRRFPHNIIVRSQNNAGQSAAENHGLKYATGEWVTFTDPDDFVGREYFSSVNRFIEAHDSLNDPVQLVACNFIIYHEHGNRIVDNHALRQRFTIESSHKLTDMGNNIHIHAGSTFFRGSIVREHMLRFDPRVVPVFQDGHFTTRFIMACNNGLIGFCRDAKYYYRKRGDSSSTIDTSHHKVSRFDDVYRYGHIPILEEATKRFGFVPRWLQRTVLYELSWEIRRMVDHAASTAFLAQEQLSTYRGLLATAFGYIDADTIRTFELGPANDFIRAGILRRFKGDTLTPGDLIVKVQQADSKRKTFVLSWFSGTPDAAFSATIDGKAVPVLNRKAVATQLLGAPFAYESRVEIFGTTIGTLVVKVNNHPTLIQCVGRPWPSCDLASAFAKLTSPTILITTTRVSEIRAKSREKEVVDRYSGAWLLMDRDMQADDNAEHLYRHIRRCRPNVKAFFVLRSSSRDWSRLQAEGFELIDFGTEEHTLALLNARFLISSHADHYVTNYLSPSEYGDLLDIKFVFLQHGVTKDDISDWLNKKNIALMCTATDPEHLSIASPVSSYKMFPSEVALTGFARHDALIARSSDVPRRLLIMPTWRNTLVGKPLGKGNDRAFRDEFLRSEYLVSWKSLLGSDRLRQSLERHRFEAVFFPHANVEIYLEHFEVPPYMNSLAHDGSASIQDLFISSALLLTDFSSVAFEMAYLNRPVVYYQFDRDKVFNGGHLTRKGYFDYERDGFGPVCLNEASVLASLDAILANNGKPCDEYTMRSMTTFKWRDGRCCERTLDAIENLSAWSGSSTLPGVGFQADLTGRDDKHWLPADVAILRREREVAANSLAREGGY